MTSTVLQHGRWLRSSPSQYVLTERFWELGPPVPSDTAVYSGELWSREIKLEIRKCYYLFREFMQTNFLQANTLLIWISHSLPGTTHRWLWANSLFIPQQFTHQNTLRCPLILSHRLPGERLPLNLLTLPPKAYKYSFFKYPFEDTSLRLSGWCSSLLQ